MAYELERIIGMLNDIRDGDGSPRMAAMIDCPVCGRPLTLDIDMPGRRLDASCPQDPAHFHWKGAFTELPGWIGQYKQLNT